MAKEFQRQLVLLPNAKAIYVYNMSLQAELPTTMVLSGQPEAVTQPDGSTVYKLNHASSGWFGSIKADDQDRLPVLRQLADGTILCQVSAPVTHTAKDFASAEPFLGAK